MPRLLELLCAHLGASSAAVRTPDESLEERTFAHGQPLIPDEHFARARASARGI
jgi:hypothetical protein